MNRILLSECETSNPVDAILPNKPGVGAGVITLDFFSLFFSLLFSSDALPSAPSESGFSVSFPSSATSSSGSSNDLTHSRAFRGSNIGCPFKTTCIASVSSAASGVLLGASLRTCDATDSKTCGPKLSPAYPPQTFSVSSRGKSFWLSILSHVFSRSGSTCSGPVCAQASTATN